MNIEESISDHMVKDVIDPIRHSPAMFQFESFRKNNPYTHHRFLSPFHSLRESHYQVEIAIP